MQVFDINRIKNVFADNKDKYQNASPFPSIFLDNFINEEAADKALSEFPRVKDNGWIHYVHVNEKKHGLNKRDLLPNAVREVIDALNTEEFVKELSDFTGIPNLEADDMLEGGGLHQTQKGGFLNIHADFTVHPHKENYRRRVNIILYLNKNWGDDWGGNLELWDREMKACESKIAPLFNRAVIFNTDDTSYHGLPDPLNCPDDESRKSIALYYFTKEEQKPKLRTTDYRARPTDGARRYLIWFDKKLIAVYTKIKRTFGLNDDFISKVLNIFSKKK
jgi:Rps23 Pro-64 3,4-dihydroxylase Tpa1-like proline 4-hydroxylase